MAVLDDVVGLAGGLLGAVVVVLILKSVSFFRLSLVSFVDGKAHEVLGGNLPWLGLWDVVRERKNGREVWWVALIVNLNLVEGFFGIG